MEVEVPVKLNQRARELIQELENELTDDGLPRKKSFMARVRSWFG
jgi:DnaJ-class molecular chaperone